MALTLRNKWIIGAAVLAAALAAVLAVLFTNSAGPQPAAGSSPSASPSPSPSTTAAPPPSASPPPASSAPAQGVAESKLAAMTLEQRVGQVLMVSSPVTGADANSLYALDTLYVGNIFMKGRSTAGTAGIGAEVANIASHVSGDRTQGVRPFVATDQEGGLVQIMRGPGFAEMPQAIEQGQLDPAVLQADATALADLVQRGEVSAAELLSYPQAITIRPPNLRKVLVQLSGRPDYAPNVECESPFSLMSVVLSSDAIGICGAYSDVFLYAKGDLVRLHVDELAEDQDALYTRYGIVSRAAVRLSPLAQAMIEQIKELDNSDDHDVCGLENFAI